MSSSFLLPSLAHRVRLCKYQRRSGAYVCISLEADEHLIIRRSFCPSLFHPCFIHLILPLLPSASLQLSAHSSFPSVQIHLHPSSLSIFLPLPPHLIPRCLSQPPLPPNALRLTTLFSFKIKIIKSAVKWERVCAAGVTMQHFDVLFQHDSINISSSVPNQCCTHSHTITHNIRTIHALTPHIPPTTSFLFALPLQYEERLIWRTKLYCFGSDFLSSDHSILYCWSHPLLFLFSFPLQTSPLSFLILCLSPSLSPPPSYSWSAGC